MFFFRFIDNRSNPFTQDDSIVSVLSTLAGKVKDITESPYFPKVALMKLPLSNKNNCFYVKI